MHSSEQALASERARQARAQRLRGAHQRRKKTIVFYCTAPAKEAATARTQEAAAARAQALTPVASKHLRRKARTYEGEKNNKTSKVIEALTTSVADVEVIDALTASVAEVDGANVQELKNRVYKVILVSFNEMRPDVRPEPRQVAQMLDLLWVRAQYVYTLN